MSGKKYWQNFGELNDAEKLQKLQQNEFREELPFEDFDSEGLMDAKAPRRDFLKYLGFSTAAAAIAAGCKVPVKHAIPYANKPEDMIPGVAKYYATTYVQDGDVLPVVAKVRDGRPIKIEGNELCSFTKGGTSARAQASVLDLYDMNRNRFPVQNVNGKFEEVPTYEQLDRMIGDAMNGLNGTSVVFLSSTIVSPTSKEIINKFLAKNNGTHVQYDGVSYSGMLLANESSFGKRAIPSYNFENAKVIVSLGADFLGTWLAPVEFARQYSKGRKIDEKNPTMSKHYQFESHLSMTGGNADERFTHRPSETAMIAMDLLNAILGTEGTVTVTDTKLEAAIKKVAAELKANNGAAVVVCGSNDVNVQSVVNAINNAIGAYGKTIDWGTTLNYRQGIDKDMEDLVAKMEAGQVGALLIHGANPVYNYYNADKFKAALSKVKLTVSFARTMDETTELCKYIVPDHHYLESWGDAEPRSGYTSFIQPTIYPLFKTRPFQTSLLRWIGDFTEYEDYFKNYWTQKLGSANAFDKALQDGVIETTATVGSGSYNGSSLSTSLFTQSMGSLKKTSGDELVLYQKVSIGTGAQAGNPWLQELPDPITKATWDNYAMISVAKAKELGIVLDIDYEYYPDKPVVEISTTKGKIQLPVIVVPGMNVNTIAIAVGYGRSEKFSKAAGNVGKNVYPFASFNGNTVDYFVTGVTVTNQHRKEKIALTQVHNSYEGRYEVVRETTFATFKKDPEVIPEYRKELTEEYYKKSNGSFRENATLYPDHAQPGLKWGMSIDMNSCISCGACVVACSAENNVPVVGKHEVMRAHEMHWLRIDRYYVSGEQDPDDLKGVIFQPMLCQHCDNAPCENVCPVAATNHSSEGLNQMAYNRCIGTRYCANNCPYKVRRFNWADYTGADSFPNNRDQTIVGKLDPVVEQMNDDVTRMVLNPDVTVRSRGVMEKCSFCVQRLQAAKLDAKKENRILKDGEARTACMMACPTSAIVFGNVHDKESAVTMMRENNPQRMYYVIEQLHTLPNVNYLEKVRNTDEVIEKKEA